MSRISEKIIADYKEHYSFPNDPQGESHMRDCIVDSLEPLEGLLDRAYKMMQMAGYRVSEQNQDHNNPIIAWMADARTMLYGADESPEIKRDLGVFG